MSTATKDPDGIAAGVRAWPEEDKAREREYRAKAEADLDGLLGPRALFKIPEAKTFGGPSPAVIYRAEKAGLIELTRIGGATHISRALMKRILLDGFGRVSFVYEKGKAAEEAA